MEYPLLILALYVLLVIPQHLHISETDGNSFPRWSVVFFWFFGSFTTGQVRACSSGQLLAMRPKNTCRECPSVCTFHALTERDSPDGQYMAWNVTWKIPPFSMDFECVKYLLYGYVFGFSTDRQGNVLIMFLSHSQELCRIMERVVQSVFL